MIPIATATAGKVRDVLVRAGSLQAAIAALSSQRGVDLPGIDSQQIITQNVAAELSEHSTVTKYPMIYVYCGKIVNSLREKFRTFSGDAQMVVEARVSQDRLDGIESGLQTYVDAITQVLDGNRGDWGDGVFFDGAYEVTFGQVKQGGRNFLQIARVGLVLEISSN